MQQQYACVCDLPYVCTVDSSLLSRFFLSYRGVVVVERVEQIPVVDVFGPQTNGLVIAARQEKQQQKTEQRGDVKLALQCRTAVALKERRSTP